MKAAAVIRGPWNFWGMVRVSVISGRRRRGVCAAGRHLGQSLIFRFSKLAIRFTIPVEEYIPDAILSDAKAYCACARPERAQWPERPENTDRNTERIVGSRA